MSNKIPSTNELKTILKENKGSQDDYLSKMRIDLYTTQQIGILADRSFNLIKSEFKDKLQRRIKCFQELLQYQKPSKKEVEFERCKVAIQGLQDLREKEHKFILWIFLIIVVMSAIYIVSSSSLGRYNNYGSIIETQKIQVPVSTFIGGFIVVLGIIISLWGCGSRWKGFIAQDRQKYKEIILKYQIWEKQQYQTQPNDALKIAEKEQVKKIDKHQKLD